MGQQRPRRHTRVIWKRRTQLMGLWVALKLIIMEGNAIAISMDRLISDHIPNRVRLPPTSNHSPVVRVLNRKIMEVTASKVNNMPAATERKAFSNLFQTRQTLFKCPQTRQAQFN